MLKSKLLLSIISGVLLSLAWPAHGFPFLIFIAFIPLFFIEDQLSKESKKPLRNIFLYTYIALFTWNALSTWWIWNSSIFGAIMAIVLNSLFMSLVWVVFSFSKKYFHHNRNAIFLLPIFWVAFEYLHLDWDLSWSWLNLGNVFANHSYAIQWYEYTGVFGGTWWILIINILIYKLLKKLLEDKPRASQLVFSSFPIFLLILTPLLFSIYQYQTYTEKGTDTEVVVVQPNMDPWSEQFLSPPQEVIDRMIQLSIPLISQETQFWVAPESAIQEGIQEPSMTVGARMQKGISIPRLQNFMTEFPNLKMVIGGSTYRFLDEATSTSRETENGGIYDEYNTAIIMNHQKVEDTYHKSKLVPGPEKMPFKSLLKPLQFMAFNLGGTAGSLGYDTERKVFYSSQGIGAAPLICYESIYGEFVTEFVKNGAQILMVITNDGWWGNTPGHQQHLAFSRLRAIETRRSVARSANTGISCFINQRGDVTEATAYWVQDARKHTMKANSELTFYVKYGDYLGRSSVFLAILLLLINVTVYFKKEKPNEVD
ncbi:apolipoprotein N-acyltransferase [Lentimicrobium sp. L6]|uniref:apolipoprotein N-acyltransferase n=1 Tax=Lentimicrobium sp. L6 TaxID=2735916 RepID=UPI001552BE27|nr:apolipoprotein N-acyltransferase [Lentimicrobium sp. L6]NPD86902.1 apolipoprotein N-acyltransferase [Lentimicrobium sp. L6]